MRLLVLGPSHRHSRCRPPPPKSEPMSSFVPVSNRCVEVSERRLTGAALVGLGCTEKQEQAGHAQAARRAQDGVAQASVGWMSWKYRKVFLTNDLVNKKTASLRSPAPTAPSSPKCMSSGTAASALSCHRQGSRNVFHSSAVRRSIARIHTIMTEKTREAVREQTKKDKYMPYDLRAKKTRALRRKMTKVGRVHLVFLLRLLSLISLPPTARGEPGHHPPKEETTGFPQEKVRRELYLPVR